MNPGFDLKFNIDVILFSYYFLPYIFFNSLLFIFYDLFIINSFYYLFIHLFMVTKIFRNLFTMYVFHWLS